MGFGLGQCATMEVFGCVALGMNGRVVAGFGSCAYCYRSTAVANADMPIGTRVSDVHFTNTGVSAKSFKSRTLRAILNCDVKRSRNRIVLLMFTSSCGMTGVEC